MIIEKGDLLKMSKDGKFDILVHGANCFNRMKSGIAKQISEQFPSAVDADNKTTEGYRSKLGTFSEVDITVSEEVKFKIINAYVQYDMNRKGVPFVDRFEYEAFQSFLNKMEEKYGNLSFGFPLIGCGLAGGNKGRILCMLEQFSNNISKIGGTVTVVVLE